MKPHQKGGNRKLQTFADCEFCENRFGPLERLDRRFCSVVCKASSMKNQISKKLGKHYPHLQRAITRICRTCKKPFRDIYGRKNRIPVYCSKLCWILRKGLITPENIRARGTSEYKSWRLAVFKRDKFVCQDCGSTKGGDLNAHHVLPFSKYIDNRYDIDNGITLCEECHHIRHQVIIDRWEKFTNRKAVRVNATTKSQEHA